MAAANFAGTIGPDGKGSEEAFDYECDACKLDGNIREAKHYCPACEDYLCITCETHHKKVKATRFHEIISVDEVTNKDSESKASTQEIRSVCPCGQNKEINYYCRDHDDCFCLLCNNIKHRKCSTLSMNEATNDDSVLQDFNLLAEKTSELTEKARQLKNECKAHKSTLEDAEKDCKADIKKFRSKLNLFLDEIERSSLEELQQTTKTQVDQVEENSTAVSSMLHLLSNHEKDIQELKETLDKRQVLISNSKLRKALKDYETVLDDVRNKSDVPHISFEYDKSLYDLTSILKKLGKVTVTYNKKEAMAKPVWLDASVKQRTVVDIKTLANKDPSITGIEFVNDGEILIADHGNAKLALLDESMTIKESMEFEVSPYDIVWIKDSEVVASLPYQQTLLYIQTAPKLHIRGRKQLDNRCWGLARTKKYIYVACNFSGERPEILQVGAASTEVKRVIDCKQVGKDISYIFNIAANQEGTRLFICDYWSHKVICMTTDGIAVYSYSDSDLKYPRGILIDSEDNALVCCEASNSIHVIKSDGTKYKTLLTSKDGINTPFAINYRASDAILAVGCCLQKSSFLVFLLKFQQEQVALKQKE